MAVLQDLKVVFDADDVLRAQGGDPAAIRSRRPAFVDLAERALAEGKPLIQPAVSYRRLAVERLTHDRLVLEGGSVLSGPLITRHLAAASQVAVIVCTVGPALEARADEVMAGDMMYGLALDGVGSAAAEALAVAACHHFEQLVEQEGLQATIPISPGMDGWPVEEGQLQIFHLVDAAEIGVVLLPSGMMVPRKSLSMVIGLGAGVSAEGVPCDYCSMAERCRYRAQDP